MRQVLQIGGSRIFHSFIYLFIYLFIYIFIIIIIFFFFFFGGERDYDIVRERTLRAQNPKCLSAGVQGPLNKGLGSSIGLFMLSRRAIWALFGSILKMG